MLVDSDHDEKGGGGGDTDVHHDDDRNNGNCVSIIFGLLKISTLGFS